jgi:hypothetical protein
MDPIGSIAELLQGLFGWLLEAGVNLVHGVIDLLPDAAQLDLSGLGGFVGIMMALNTGLPVAEAVGLFGVWLTVMGGIVAYRIAKEVMEWLPFV